jgi:hypothetical protein
VKRNNKQYFVYYLKENILIFDVFDFLEEFAADYVDYCHEWGLIKDGFVSEKPKHIKDYVNLYVSDVMIKINTVALQTNCRFLCFYKKKNQLNHWHKFFNIPESFIKIAKKILKKRLINFIEVEEENLFLTIKGTFKDVPCLIPSGEDETFLTKSLNKLKKCS